MWIEIIECQVAQIVQVAQLEEALAHQLADLPLAARADLDPSKFGVAQGDILAQIANAMTFRTVRVAREIVGIWTRFLSVR